MTLFTFYALAKPYGKYPEISLSMRRRGTSSFDNLWEHVMSFCSGIFGPRKCLPILQNYYSGTGVGMSNTFDATIEVRISHAGGADTDDTTRILEWLVSGQVRLKGDYGKFTFDACTIHSPEDCDFHSIDDGDDTTGYYIAEIHAAGLGD